MSFAHLSEVVWRSFPPDTRYEASSMGEIRKRDERTRDRRWKVLSQWALKGESRGGKGYRCAYVNGRIWMVSRVVCWCFNGPPSHLDLHAAHENGIRDDNRPSNLCWKSPRANEQDKKRHGTFQEGENHHSAKLSDAQVVDLRMFHQLGHSYKKLAEEFGISTSHARSICYGISRKLSDGPRVKRNKRKPNLEPEDIRIIKKLHDRRFTNAEIASLYRVNTSTISRITAKR